MKRSLILGIFLLLSVFCFAQRGGGGGFGGGGGRGGGGGNRGGGNNWGAAAFNDTIPFIRQGGTMYWDNGRNSAVRDDDLKLALGDEKFEAYQTANRLFIKGDYRQSAGVLLYIPAAVLGVMSYAKKKTDPHMSSNMAIIAGSMMVPATACVIWGAKTKNKAKSQIDGLASDYNQKVEKKKSGITATLGMTVNDLALGAGLRLSF